jgi:transposase-like protein
MGRFDSVHVNCPHCLTSAVVHTKAGEPRQNDWYNLKAIPKEIAQDLENEKQQCKGCFEQFRLVIDHTVAKTVVMRVVAE